MSLQSLFLCIQQFATCVRQEWKECSTFSPPATVVLLLFLAFEALLFAIFTVVMLGTQLQAIWNDETVRIEYLIERIFVFKKFIYIFIIRRVSSNLKKKKPDGFAIVNGNRSKLYLEDFQLLGSHLSRHLPRERRSKKIIYIPCNMLTTVCRCNPGIFNTCKYKVIVTYH